jgi:peptidoglycan-N-acetylglucosamine deacetylase
MNYLENKQIFFAPSKKRKRSFYFVSVAFFLFFISCLALTTWSILSISNPLSTAQVDNFSQQLPAGNDSGFSAFQPGNPSLEKKIGTNNDSTYKRMAFFVNWDEKSFLSLQKNIQNIDVLIPEWLHLGDSGAIIPDDTQIQQKTEEFIKGTRPTLSIYALINNFDQESQTWNSQRLEQMLGNENLRRTNIDNLFQYVQENNFSGISIDYEGISPQAQAQFLVFMRELYSKFNPSGLIVTVNIPLSDPDFNQVALSQSCDEIILMAYDENTSDTPLAGPVASDNWYTSSLKQRLIGVPPEKYIISLGSYGYDWANDGTAETVDFQSLMSKAKDTQSDIKFNSVSLNPNFAYTENGKNHQLWFLDSVSFFNQTSEMLNLGQPAGIALWRLGSEDPSVWNVFGSDKNQDQQTAESLRYFDSGYGVEYTGKGEILKAIDNQKSGYREISFDQQKKIILDEKMVTFPSSLRIEQQGGSDPKKISLSFDDGPDKDNTPKILDVLDRFGVKASFFVIGLNATADPDILRRIYNDGHEIGIHTFTHPEISSISSRQFGLEVGSTERLIESLTGNKTTLFRPPYIDNIDPLYISDAKMIKESSDLGYYTVGMGIDPEDWKNANAQTIAEYTINEVSKNSGNIILLHDGGGNRSETVKALPWIISGLESQGYQFVSLSELMQLPKSNIMPAVSSSEAPMTRVNLISFSFFSLIGQAVKFLFFSGVILASIRIIFIAILAEIQIRKTKKLNRLVRGSKLLENLSLSVVIPAYNEEKVIIKTIRSLLHSSSVNDFDIIVVNDGSTDDTASVMRKKFSSNPKIKFYSIKNGGKAAALNFGISKTNADIIITLDADTVFRQNTIAKLIRRFDDPSVGAVAGNVRVGNQRNLITRWQAIEYITSQNFDRRAFEMVNAISVVPGSVGAWRKKAIMEAGGFSGDTLAEDADLTFSIIRNGYKTVFEDKAIGYTESPDTIRSFLKQRFRWMYGMLQVAWKNLDLLFGGRFNGLSLVAIPNILIFQVFFALISPVMDLFLLFSIAWAFWQKSFHPNDFSAIFSIRQVLIFYLYFTLIDILIAVAAFLSEDEKKWRLLPLLPLQRFFYRQLLYVVAIKSLITAISGNFVSWGKLERKNTVQKSLIEVARI